MNHECLPVECDRKHVDCVMLCYCVWCVHVSIKWTGRHSSCRLVAL